MISSDISKRKAQRGMSIFGLLLVLSVAIFIGLFAIKVFPHYLDNWAVNQVVEDLQTNQQVLKQPPSKIYDHINQAYRQNNLWDLKAEDTIIIKRGQNRMHSVAVSYERRSTLFHNIDVVTSFGDGG